MVAEVVTLTPARDQKPFVRWLRKLMVRLRCTPLHPQWLVFRQEDRNLADIGSRVTGLVLDVGCAGQRPRRFLGNDCEYLGLDYYYTAVAWYDRRPQIFGDAHALPIADAAVDSVLLLDVLEHLPRPWDGLGEIGRVLRTGGVFVLQVPFLYPIHDAPLDFQRWTAHGLQRLIEGHGFQIEEQRSFNSPMESAALLYNLALSKTVLNWLSARHVAAILTPLVPLLILANNLLGWVLSRFGQSDGFMASGYLFVCRKTA